MSAQCEHCGAATDHTYQGVALCYTHAAFYSLGVGADEPDVVEFFAAAARLGYRISLNTADQHDYIVRCPHPSVIIAEGIRFPFGEVTGHIYHLTKNPAIKVTIAPTGHPSHPHVSNTNGCILCLDQWQSAIERALRDREWERGLLLIYESACHYSPGGSYRTLRLPCTTCEAITDLFCVECSRPFCVEHLNSNRYCSDCQPKCSVCGRSARYRTCAVCGGAGCDECLDNCQIHRTERWLCHVHSSTCDECGRTICAECASPKNPKECHNCYEKRQKKQAAILERLENTRQTVAHDLHHLPLVDNERGADGLYTRCFHRPVLARPIELEF